MSQIQVDKLFVRDHSLDCVIAHQTNEQNFLNPVMYRFMLTTNLLLDYIVLRSFNIILKCSYLDIVSSLSISITVCEIENLYVATHWLLTLSNAEGGGQSSSSIGESCFSAMEHRMDPRPVCKLEFVRCGPVEKDQSALSVWV